MAHNILVPVDLEDLAFSKQVLAAALEQCKDADAQLSLLTVLPGYSMSIVGQFFPKDFEKKSLDAAGEKLKAFIADNVPKGIKIKSIVANGSIYEEILAAAKNTNCDLIVVGAHRPTVEQYLLGPNAAKVVRHAKCSVFVVRP